MLDRPFQTLVFVSFSFSLVLWGCGQTWTTSGDLGSPPGARDCGDGTCDQDESCATCSDDCGVCPASCGDDTCDADEDCQSCDTDCGVCEPFCGDNTCDADEDCEICAVDCGECPDPCGAGSCLETLPVIPGGVGFGMETPAGRGGKVIRVTNLNASGTGSLKACLDDDENIRFVIDC